jgi:hypothetical protein
MRISDRFVGAFWRAVRRDDRWPGIARKRPGSSPRSFVRGYPLDGLRIDHSPRRRRVFEARI